MKKSFEKFVLAAKKAAEKIKKAAKIVIKEGMRIAKELVTFVVENPKLTAELALTTMAASKILNAAAFQALSNGERAVTVQRLNRKNNPIAIMSGWTDIFGSAHYNNHYISCWNRDEIVHIINMLERSIKM